MGHFAKVVDSKVVQVIVAEEDFFKTFVDTSPGAWIKTSYNTIANEHTQGGTPLRGNYAGIGYTYDATHDVFYPPQPFASWVMDQETWTWKAPVDMPTEGGPYVWDETTTSWKAIATPTTNTTANTAHGVGK
jgi:hypothetical protein